MKYVRVADHITNLIVEIETVSALDVVDLLYDNFDLVFSNFLKERYNLELKDLDHSVKQSIPEKLI